MRYLEQLVLIYFSPERLGLVRQLSRLNHVKPTHQEWSLVNLPWNFSNFPINESQSFLIVVLSVRLR